MKNLKTLVEGIVNDLIKAERAISVIQSVGKRSNEINLQSIHVRNAFAYYQGLALHEYVLAVARLYDKPSKRNKTRCIEKLILKVKDQPTSFSKVIEKYQVNDHIRYYNLPNYLSNYLEENDDQNFTRHLGLIWYQDFVNLEKKRTIIKDWRDKILSHNDEDNKVDKIVFSETKPLLDFGWQIITIVGWAFLSTAYGIAGTNHLREDCNKYGSNLNRLLDEYLDCAQHRP